MYKILMTYDSQEGLDQLLNHPEFKVEVHAKPSPEEFKELIKDYDGLIIRSEVKVTEEIIGAAQKLKFIGRAGTGVDNVDKKAASQKGIVVSNVPGGNTISVAEHTIGLILSMARNIPAAVTSMQSQKWEKKKFMGNEIFGKTLGLIGLGRIGNEVAKRLLSFGMKVVAYDPFANAEVAKNNGIELTTLDEVFKQADYLSIHSPLTDDTRGMINKANIAKMKDGVRIINCARGAIINDADLIEAVKSGKVANAALDVFVKEPPVDWSIQTTPNIITTPHLAASTEEAQVKIAIEMASVVIDFFTKGLIRNAVNVATVDWDTQKQMMPYIELADKIGSFQGQIIEGGISEIELSYCGNVSEFKTNPLTVAYMKGILGQILDLKINSVNAISVAKERGINIKEVIVKDVKDYTNLILAKVKTDKGEYSIAGTLLDKQQRIVNINGLNVDVKPEGHKIFINNTDKPGVIGTLGTIIGSASINIAGMNVGRKESGKQAITVLEIDGEVSNDVIAKIAKVEGVTKVKNVVL